MSESTHLNDDLRKYCGMVSHRVYPSVTRQGDLGFRKMEYVYGSGKRGGGRLFWDEIEPGEAGEKLTVVAFRGSQSTSHFAFALDWLITDFNMRMTTRSFGGESYGIHAGFDWASRYPERNSGKPMFDTLRERLDRLYREIPQQTKLIFTGHSLGGALAMIAAFRLTLEHGDPYANRIKAVVTLGQPMVGDSRFAGLYRKIGLEEKTLRAVNRSDLVTKGHLWPGYQHVGQLVKLNVRPVPTNLRGRLFYSIFPWGYDHFPEHYFAESSTP